MTLILVKKLVSTPSGYAHGDSLVINGTGFGTKSPAAPLLWDDCNHGQSVATRWAGRAPTSAPAGYNLDYYVPNTGNVPNVPLPHSNAGTKIMAGCHHTDTISAGRNVGPIFELPFSNGDNLYMYFFQRRGPSFSLAGSGNDNYKIWYADHASAGFYDNSTDGYIEYKESSVQYMKWNSGYSLESPDDWNTAFDWIAQPAGDIDTSWVFQEWFWGLDDRLASAGGDGFIYVIDNNADRVSTTANVPTGALRVSNINKDKLIFWYEGARTLPASSGGTAYGCIGGFSNVMSPTNNWRYWADLYIDNTWSRVVLTDNATYDSATEIVPQIPTAWGSTEITVTVNKGRLASGTAHLFVFDSANARQYIGEVTLT